MCAASVSDNLAPRVDPMQQHLQAACISAASTDFQGRLPAIRETTCNRDRRTYLRLVTHFKFLIVGPDQSMVTKRP